MGADSLGDETLLGEGSEGSGRGGPLSHGDLVGRYILLEERGRGATGRVFSAYDPSLDRRVAIKILHETRGADEADLDRSLHEAKAMARIDHPHVVTVHDAGIHDGAVFIAMELVEGSSLDVWLASGRGRAEVLDVFIDAARGLQAAHAAGVVHRDFKPANVLVGRDGRAKVGDFGLAGIEERTTAPGEDGHAPIGCVGTPAYMSPEHVRGVGIDARSDQFSFCIALHEALRGHRPFSGDSLAIVAANIVAGAAAPSVATGRGRLGALVRRGLQVDPAARFPSMGEVASELERIRRPRWPWVMGAAAIAAVAAVAFAWTSEGIAACQAGSDRVTDVLADASIAAAAIGGDGYTGEFLASARERFTAGLAEYGSRWGAEYDRVCAAVGPDATAGTAPERVTAQCLENRIEAVRGLVGFAVARSVDAGDVEALLDALPSVSDCVSGHWAPTASDPDTAARVARLDEEITRITWARIAEDHEGLLEDAKAIAEEARALAEPYILSRALTELARVEADAELPDDADLHLREAMTIALAAGLDWQAAMIVNHMLVEDAYREGRMAGVPQLASIGRGLVARAGGGEILLGRIALNEGLALRGLGRPTEALELHDQAAAHFAAGDSPGEVVKARLNRIHALTDMGELELALAQLEELTPQIEATLGAESREAIVADQNIAAALAYAGRNQQAVVAGRRAFVRASKRYDRGSATLFAAAWNYAATALHAGELDEAEAMITLLRTLPASESDRLYLEAFAADHLVASGRMQDAVTVLDAARARADPARHRVPFILLEFERARVAYILGDDAAAVAPFGHPAVTRFLREDTIDHAVRMDVVCLAIVVGAPDPPGEPWTAVLERLPALTPNVQAAARVARVVAAGSPGEVRRERDALVHTYFEGAPEIRLLDAWLSRRVVD
jgi:tetratricopeptide (TPR) repeat protein